MTDLSTQFANRFETSLAEAQSGTDEVNARLQRIEELERTRQERLSNNASSNNDAQSRLQRRERFIRQTTQTRSMERRGFASNIQRTPIARSQTIETSSQNSNEESLSLRGMFESARQNLFVPRISASSENLSTFHRSNSDNRLMASRANTLAVPEDGDSASSSPRTTPRPSWDFASGLAEAFSSVRSSLHRGSDTNLTTRESIRPSFSIESRETERSPSATRETRNPSTNYQRFLMSNQTPSSTLSRSSSLRESRTRESRFRRRTIQGVDSNVTQALERERVTTESRTMAARASSRSESLTRIQSRSQIARNTSETISSTTEEGSRVTETVSTASSYSEYGSYSSYSGGTRNRKVELFPDDSLPVLALEDEKVKFIDSQGHCHWLSKHHQLLRIIKNTNNVPDIIKKDKLKSNDPSNSDGFVATLDDNKENRIKVLHDLVRIARKRHASLENGDCVDSGNGWSLLELYQRGDFVDELQADDEVEIDKKYKSYSLYSPPRAKPDLEEYLSSREVLPLYHGIERPDENRNSDNKKEKEPLFVTRGPVQYELSAARLEGGRFLNVGTRQSSANGSSGASASNSNGSIGARASNSNGGGRVEGVSLAAQRRAEARQQLAASRSSNGHQQQQSVTYHQSVSEEVRRQESFSSDNQEFLDNSDIHSEVNLVMERLALMQGTTGMDIDTSHLDYEEMMMIQQALADNPSPPETPPAMSPRAVEYVDEVDSVPVEIPQSVSRSTSHGLPRMNSAPAEFSTPRATDSSVSFTQHASRTEHASRSVSSEDGQRAEETLSRSANQTVTASIGNTGAQIVQSETQQVSASQTILSNTTAVPTSLSISQAIERTNTASRVSVSPRLARISSSGSESMLPLPSMDFSPFDRSPQRSPQRFNFSESGPTTEGTGSSVSPNVHSELTIEIPENKSPSPTGSNPRSTGTPNTPKSPMVKSRNSSLNGSAAVSPAGSDTVTTVFEEFVQTIPKNMLSEWASNPTDER